MRDKRSSGVFVFVGILFTLLLHVGVLGGYWLARAQTAGAAPLGPGTYVDAALVKFGKPRDLSFLPHKVGQQHTKDTPTGLKIATSDKALPHLDDKKKDEPQKDDPLAKINAQMRSRFKPDEPEGFEQAGEGSPTGSKSGTATEARGDPYIQEIMAAVGDSWQIPTTIKESELASLKATVCLTIDRAGKLTHFEFRQHSTSSQFDSSLEAALGTLKKLSPPPDRFAAAAGAGLLCPNFSK
jgi:TonB C terminal